MRYINNMTHHEIFSFVVKNAISFEHVITILFFFSPFTSQLYAPINVMPAAGGGGGGQGIGWGFDFFQKISIKFPAHGESIPVKCNQISPSQAAHCCQSQGWTQERQNKNISK